MARVVGIICSVAVLMLLSGCGEQLVSEAQKAVDQIAAEATKTATQRLDEFKNATLLQLRQMRGEENNGKTDAISGVKPTGTVDAKTVPKPNW